MSEIGNHITQLFRKYLKGDISRMEQRALDKKVQEDAYAQDAKQGLDQLSIIDRITASNNLDARLKARVQKDTPKRRIGWMSMAAGIAILVVGALLVRQQIGGKTDMAEAGNNSTTVRTNAPENQTNKTKTIGAEHVSDFIVQIDENTTEGNLNSDNKDESTRPIDSIGSSVTFDVEVYNQGTVSKEAVTVYAGDNYAEEAFPNPASPKNYAEAFPSQANQLDDVLKMESQKAEKTAEANQQNGMPSSNNSSASVKAKKAQASAFADSDIIFKTILGTITDQAGESIIGASVVDTKNNLGSTTNFDGTFTLDVPTDVDKLTISYIGFSEQVVDINNNNEVFAQLTEDNLALDEVVVIASSREKVENTTYQWATPKDGKSAFKKYIKENLVSPSQATNAGITGKVVLLFNVDDAGIPIDIEVEKSLGYGCDEEAIRLLRDGPKWTQGTLSEKNRLVVRFK